MGAEGFHGRVRDGIGCLAPRYGHQAQRDATEGSVWAARGVWRCTRAVVRCAWRTGSKPIERLVPVSCAGYPASTSGLST
jgi:hypothetical protein